MRQIDHSLHLPLTHRRFFPLASSLGALLVIAGCGGGGNDDASPSPMAAASAASAISVVVDGAGLPAEAGSETAQPTFHVAPVLLPEPPDTDAIDNIGSASGVPHSTNVTPDDAALGTARLTVQRMQANARAHALSAPPLGGSVAPAATTTTATTYTPAQIRAAYALPSLPSSSVVPTALQLAQQGAGQTIYIVNAMHGPNVAAELASFNSKFGLPGCTTKPVAVSASLPLTTANAADGCTLTVVYSTPSGGMTATAPAYDAGWATEIALDVQWAHATAPRARIILIESADASLNGLLGAVKLANSMGTGTVSMSFGAGEGNWTSQVDSAFAAGGMTYLAATGDSGSAVSWPAVSPNVLAVGGTTLRFSGTSPRSEIAWSKGGGGISVYTATPAYQSNKVPGVGVLAHRAVADVSFNADPYTGQYVAVIPQGSATVNWIGAGGTSLSTPQWAGLVAIANAMRVQAAKAVLSAPHNVFYAQIAQTPGSYAASFGDVVSGSDGSCATCAAKIGYDVPTGLGSPNASALLAALVSAGSVAPSAPVAPAAPVVAAAATNGKVGSAFSYTVSVTGGKATSFMLTGAPSGMTITNTGTINWASPVAGTYALTVTAFNSASGLSGKGLISVVIASPAPPIITAPSIVGVAGKPLAGVITVSSPSGNPITLQISGVPIGVQFSVSGQSLVLNWPKPVAGKYSVSIAAKDSAGLSASATLSISVSAK